MARERGPFLVSSRILGPEGYCGTLQVCVFYRMWDVSFGYWIFAGFLDSGLGVKSFELRLERLCRWQLRDTVLKRIDDAKLLENIPHMLADSVAASKSAVHHGVSRMADWQGLTFLLGGTGALNVIN